MISFNEEEYTKRYNIVENFAYKQADKFKSKEISYDDYISTIKQKIKEVGLKSPSGGLLPQTPYSLFHEKEVILEKGKCPDSWTSPYYVPKGNWLYDKKGDCGVGCLCVDSGADRPSLDIINSNSLINVEQVCDGSPEHKHRPRTTPMLALEYKSKRPINLERIRSACKTSERISVDDRTRPRIINNICTNEETTEESTKQTRRNGKPGIAFFGKNSNSREFWEDVAYSLSDIEDIGMGRQEQKIRSEKTNSTKKLRGFSFGKEFQM